MICRFGNKVKILVITVWLKTVSKAGVYNSVL
jgi:hypothetical protein